jgi:hypothetical protein
MAMLNWNDYRSQILAHVGEIGKLSPDTVKGYMTLGGAGAKTGDGLFAASARPEDHW